MEFEFNINRFFPLPITKFCAQDIARCDPELWKVLDVMGEASRVAQQLRRPVTVANSFVNSNQTLYIMTDETANNGLGAVLGMLKIGPKKLFLLDTKGMQNELDPLCVLDFYIHESCQRMGLGKILFAHFLEDQKLPVKKMAIDRPSEKFLGFLQKHYGLVKFIPQVNNFVIYEGFFDSDVVSNNKSTDIATNLRSSISNSPSSVAAFNASAIDESIALRARGRPSVTECLYDQSESNQNELWRTNSMSNINRTPSIQIVPVKPSPFSAETASKFGHHRLW